MADQKDARTNASERTEWPRNPPLPPRELDPDGEGDALRSKARPGDDMVFAANAKQRSREEDATVESERRAEERKRQQEDPRPHIDR